MDSKRKILSSIIFTVLLAGFVYFYIANNKNADAASLVFCVNASNNSDYYVIDDTYSCPAGYNKVNGDYNLILNNYSNTNINTNTTGSTTSQNNPNATPNSPAWNYLYTNTNSTNNTASQNNANNTNNINNISNINYANNANNTNYINSLNNQNSNINNVNTEVVIPVDPTLANGPFTYLDPTDYQYCVILTKDLYYGVTGNEVSALQEYLTDRGFLDIGSTGFYGRITEFGVRKFQYRNQIEVTGTVTQDMRDILKELTCIKYPKVSYVDKPVSPSVIKATPKKTTTTSTTVKTTKTAAVVKSTVIPTTKVDTATKTVSITPTPQTNTTGISTLSSYAGNMYTSQKNSLYFNYLTKSTRPYICVNINNTDCTQSSNYGPVVDGIVKGYYEVVSVSGKWAFNIYNSSSWGSVGDKVKIYLKDSQAANTVSIYTINILN